MSFTRQLVLTLALVVSVPVTGLLLLDQLRDTLVNNQPTAQRLVASMLADTIPADLLPPPPENALAVPVLKPPHTLEMDGFEDDWRDWSEALERKLGDSARLRLASDGLYLYALLTVTDRQHTDASRLRLWIDGAEEAPAIDITPKRPGTQATTGHPQAQRILTAWQPGLESSVYEWRLPQRLVDRSLALQLDAGTVKRVHPLTPSPALNQQLNSMAPDGHRIWITSQSGHALASSAPISDLPSQPEWWVSLLGQHLLLGHMAPRIDASSRALPPPIGQPENTWLRRGEHRLSVISRVPLEQAPGWVFLLEAPAQLDGLISPSTMLALLLMALVGFVLAPSGIVVSALRIRRRIRQLQRASRQAITSPETRLPMTGNNDDLDRLTQDFNRLLETLGEQNDYLAQLGARLGHEMRTPLTAARSSLQNLAFSDQDNQALVVRAEQNLDRLSRLLLALGEARRLEDGLGSAEWLECNINELAANTLESAADMDPNHRYRCIVSDAPLSIYCAPDLLVLALEKLLANAREFTPTGGQIRLSVQPQRDQIEIRLSNTGSHLEPGTEQRIFDNLVSIRKSQQDRPHLGLGLHIVRLVARIHTGRAYAFNASDGVGFVIRLPANRGQ